MGRINPIDVFAFLKQFLRHFQISAENRQIQKMTAFPIRPFGNQLLDFSIVKILDCDIQRREPCIILLVRIISCRKQDVNSL